MRAPVRPLVVLLGVALAAGCGSDEESAAEPPAFEGVPWVLASGLDVDGWESARPSAVFAGGTVGGSGGCNRYTASYTVDGEELRIGTVAATRMACPPPADAVESAYLATLGRVAEWRTDLEELLLLDGDGAELLRFRGATPVGDWEATAVPSGNAFASPLPGTRITATFAEDGTLVGSAGCNTYRTTYRTDRGGIEIGPPAATKMACAAPDGVMEQESAFLAALPSAVHYRVDGDSLALTSADGTYVASFMRAAGP